MQGWWINSACAAGRIDWELLPREGNCLASIVVGSEGIRRSVKSDPHFVPPISTASRPPDAGWVNPHDAEAEVTTMKIGTTLWRTRPSRPEIWRTLVPTGGLQELVADKGYRSGKTLMTLQRLWCAWPAADDAAGRAVGETVCASA